MATGIRKRFLGMLAVLSVKQAARVERLAKITDHHTLHPPRVAAEIEDRLRPIPKWTRWRNCPALERVEATT